MDVVLTCQGGDYTNEIFPQLRAAGWKGYWIDAASSLRMKDDAIIVLDPVNRTVIQDGLSRGIKNYIGGNCTVSLMLMALGGLFENDLIEWATSMTYQAASGAGAQNMRELIAADGTHPWLGYVPICWPTRRSAILDIDKSQGCRDDPQRGFPMTKNFRNTALAGSLIPWIDVPYEHGCEQGRMEGRRRVQQDPRQASFPVRPAVCRLMVCACVSAQCVVIVRR